MNNGNMTAICHGITSRSDNNANTSAQSDPGPALDYKRAPQPSGPACIHTALARTQWREMGNRRNSILTRLLCHSRDINHLDGNSYIEQEKAGVHIEKRNYFRILIPVCTALCVYYLHYTHVTVCTVQPDLDQAPCPAGAK